MNAELHRLGHDVLGPVFATFSRLLLSVAARDGVTRLAFVARDGHYLREVTSLFIEKAAWTSPPALDYAYLSRMSTLLSRYESFRDAVAAESGSLFGAQEMDVAALLRYFGIDASPLEPILAKHGLTHSTPVTGPGQLRLLLDDRTFAAAVEGERARQHKLLGAYLEQTAVLSDPALALVDLGWRGSIPAAISIAFQKELGERRLRACNLAYWDESGSHATPLYRMTGILADSRRRRTPREGAAFYAAYLLEALCRAPHGTVIGYQREGDRGQVTPVLADDHPHREQERAGELWRAPIRQGIADFIEAHAADFRETDAEAARSEAQRRLFRLAFFPTRAEVASVAGLAHTEGYKPAWIQPLIDPDRPSPFRAPRRWLAGLASPWRGGYVMATGGRPLAMAFTALESLLLAFPSVRRTARKLALALSKGQ